MKGEAFGDVVKDVSDDPGSKNNGGEYKDTKRGQMVPEFDQLTFSQVVGEVSAPFRTQFGWHILKVLKRTDPKEKLKELMLNQKAGEFVQGLIDKAKAEIPIKMVELPEPPPSAPQIMPMPAPVQK